MSHITNAPKGRPRGEPAGGSVALVAWPEEAVRSAEVARAGQPQLLLVAPDAAPPPDWDRLTDWIRLPADERDVTARMTALQRRVTAAGPPTLDEFDVLRRGGRWTALSPIEARIVQLLLANFGGVVPRRDLDAIWANGMPGRSLDVRLTKLRERIAGLGLHIHTVRNQGLLLEVADFAGF
jgi:hypothetical protein